MAMVLEAIQYPMRIRDLKQFGFSEVLFPDRGVMEE